MIDTTWRSSHSEIQQEKKHKSLLPVMLSSGLLLCTLLLAACSMATSQSQARGQQQPQRTFTRSSHQPISYSTSAQNVIIRTFYGGGATGALSLAPQLSIYGDGTYITGVDRRGKMSDDVLQTLLDTLVNQDGLLNFTRQSFIDSATQDISVLELSVNGKQKEFAYGPFSQDQASVQDMEEYQQLGNALTSINDALQGPTQAYKGAAFALLARQIFNQDPESVAAWPLNDFTLAQAAIFECGTTPADDTSQNAETACLKFTIPRQAILLSKQDAVTLQGQMPGMQGKFLDQGAYYTVTLRPLLPDEQAYKTLAMFGGNQDSFHMLNLREGRLPAV